MSLATDSVFPHRSPVLGGATLLYDGESGGGELLITRFIRTLLGGF